MQIIGQISPSNKQKGLANTAHINKFDLHAKSLVYSLCVDKNLRVSMQQVLK